MASKALPCPTVLRQLLRYEPETGKLFWRERPAIMFPDKRAWKSWTARYANKEAFTALASGYRIGTIFRQSRSAHRIAWAVYHGAWPDKFIDHINGVRTDNRISNLRLATHTENMRNRKINKNNKSGLKGVHWCKSSDAWCAFICFETKRINLGSFATKEDAHAAYCMASEKLHGAFSRTD